MDAQEGVHTGPTVLSVDVGRKNLALCMLRAAESYEQDVIVQWTVTACDPTASGLARCLDGIAWACECDDVVVERQPIKNATMTRLQHYLEMYFVLRGKPVTVLDAKHKLNFAASTPWWPREDIVGWTYHTRKKLAVRTMAAFLKTATNAHWAPMFDAAPKKDDFADSALQAMAYAHHVRPLELAKRNVCPVVRPRKPTAAQRATGRYSACNVAYLLKGVDTAEGVASAAAGDKHLQKAIAKHFGTHAGCLSALAHDRE